MVEKSQALSFFLISNGWFIMNEEYLEVNFEKYCKTCQNKELGEKFDPFGSDTRKIFANPFIKHYYCCCGDSEFYGKDITNLGFTKCDSFEEL